MTPTCGIIIATHNRKEDLRKTLGEIFRLSPQPAEVIICADACTDGTEGFVRETYPAWNLLVNKVSKGSIGSRDMLMRAISTDIALSFDDDSHPIESNFIQGVCELFENNPKLAVASFPQHTDEFPESLTQKDFGPSRFVGSYASSSAAIRKRTYIETGGYIPFFYHVYEEPDFALRCIAAGWQVRYETSLHVRHHYSGLQRNELRIHQLQARNELWSVVMRCPFPYFIPVAVFRIARQFNYARKRGTQWMIQEPRWWLSFFTGLRECLSHRVPIRWNYYSQWMKLVRESVFSKEKKEPSTPISP